MKKVLIKKYANRRLYNMSSGCYIVHDDLIQMISEGIRVKIIDAQTEEDITLSILLHAVADHDICKVFKNTSKNITTISLESQILQEVLQICLDNPGSWLVQYLEVISNYIKDIQHVYNDLKKLSSVDPIGSFIHMQKVQNYNTALVQQLIDLARRHFT